MAACDGESRGSGSVSTDARAAQCRGSSQKHGPSRSQRPGSCGEKASGEAGSSQAWLRSTASYSFETFSVKCVRKEQKGRLSRRFRLSPGEGHPHSRPVLPSAKTCPFLSPLTSTRPPLLWPSSDSHRSALRRWALGYAGLLPTPAPRPHSRRPCVSLVSCWEHFPLSSSPRPGKRCPWC